MPTTIPANSTSSAQESRRNQILSAARVVFERDGGLSAGMRSIATQAGCTTGAIYGIFSGKEEIYAALLTDSLNRLSQTVAAASGRQAKPEEAFRAAARAFLDFYLEREFDFKLGLYLFESDERRGLNEEADQQLNALLDNSLHVFRVCIERLENRIRPTASPEELAAVLFSNLLGILMTRFTGRDRSVGTTVDRQFEIMMAGYLGARPPAD